MKERLRISLKRAPAMVVNRISIRHQKLAYVICANKKIPYPKGNSPVVYIGTTKTGIDRVAQSASYWSEDILDLRGVNSFEVRIVTCDARQAVRSWHKLERALLLEFREKYGSIPLCNTAGKNFVETNEFDKFFARKRVRDILDNLADAGVAPEHLISR
jgi:hypothetical protein